jgi:4-hydroxybenzoate polyprenyltransferase
MNAEPQVPESQRRRKPSAQSGAMADTVDRPADAIRLRFIDRAPAKIEPYLRLMRLDRPIGIWLLFWPCVFGLELGTTFRAEATFPKGLHILLCAIGAILMRGAGCTYNDIVDRHIDAQVARTRGRPIPSGAVTVKQAWIFMAAQLVAALGTLVAICIESPTGQFNRFAAYVAVTSLFFVAAYPFMKRITWWPQAWLGLTFNWGVLFGFAAAAATLDAPAWLFYAGCFFWTIGYDTLYAFTDIQDDLLIGVKSSAIRLGERAYQWLYAFYASAIGLMLAGGVAAGLGLIYMIAMLMPALHFYWQMRRVRINDAATCLRLFKANRDAGALIALALLIGAILQV